MTDTSGWSEAKILRDAAKATNSEASWLAATAASLWQARDTLIRAIGSGETTVRVGDVTRTFRSVAELQQALVAIEAQIRKGASITPRVSTITVLSTFDK